MLLTALGGQVCEPFPQGKKKKKKGKMKKNLLLRGSFEVDGMWWGFICIIWIFLGEQSSGRHGTTLVSQEVAAVAVSIP